MELGYLKVSFSREEKRIALRVSSHSLAVISRRIEFLPHARWKDVFVSLIPSSVHHFGKVGVIAVAFEVGVLGGYCCCCCCLFDGRSGKRIVIGEF